MRPLRPVFYLTIFILLCVAVTGAYLYPRLPLLAAQQAESLLADYGVESIELERPLLGVDHLQLDTLELTGEIDELAFHTTLYGVNLHYNWLSLLRGRLGTLSVDRMHATLEQLPTVEEKETAPIVIGEMLPHLLMSSVPVESITIKQLELAYVAAPGQAPLSAAGNLTAANQVKLQMAGSYLDRLLSITLHSEDKDEPLALTLTVTQGDDTVFNLQAALMRQPSQQWQWDVLGTMDWAGLLAWVQGPAREVLPIDNSLLEPLVASGSSAFQGTISHPDALYFSDDEAAATLHKTDVNMAASNVITTLNYPPYIEDLQGEFNASLTLTQGHYAVTLGATRCQGAVTSTQLQLSVQSRQWLGWQKTVPIAFASAELEATAVDGNGMLAAQAKVNGLAMGNAASQLLINRLHIMTRRDGHQQQDISTELKASLQPRLQKTQLPGLELAAQHHGSLEEGRLMLQLSDTAESLRFLLNGSGNLKTGRGRYSLQAQSLDLPYASSTTLPLLQKFGLLEQDFELFSGKFTLDTDIESTSFNPQDWRATSSLIAEDLSASLDEIQFTGASMSARWLGIDRWKTLAPAELRIANLDVGFDISAIRATASLPRPTAPAQPAVNIESFSANMFGGRVYLARPYGWDFSSSSNQVTLQAEQWKLSELVALQQDQQIEADGTLEGELPLTLRDGRLIIDKGYLQARAPGGDIRYTPNAASQSLATSSPELGTAIDLLRNFGYERLATDVELDESGQLVLGLSLSGRNPDKYNGRLVNFNINLEQNVDPLLQSLRLSDTLVKGIEKQIK